ncbi:OLC1v1026394C1 [Oldenlandia corymbosa var. corymbosa]|uniref:OLC1v1026394C1 n=1 Tax=Oldenlandia corymbosa var. corymbosa TaxID=529605 RepID=A0AAV1C8P6_OLDCO|nr:OLC1v1026394C1 [Oldenlandia corymbosa var. corymbosa]
MEIGNCFSLAQKKSTAQGHGVGGEAAGGVVVTVGTRRLADFRRREQRKKSGEGNSENEEVGEDELTTSWAGINRRPNQLILVPFPLAELHSFGFLPCGADVVSEQLNNGGGWQKK